MQTDKEDQQYNLPKLLKPENVANVLNCSIPQVYKLASTKQIGSYKLGRTVRISMEQLREYLLKKSLQSE